MTYKEGLAYYTYPNVDNLLAAFIQLILMKKEFLSRIINLVPDKIQKIEDVLIVPVSAIGII